MSWNITPLYFCSSNNIYFFHKEPIKTQFFETFECVLGSKFVKFFMSILKRQVSSFSSFVSFFIVMTHNFSVNFKLIHFLLWTKGSHQSSNFDTFECSGENLSDSSCHFPSNKSIFVNLVNVNFETTSRFLSKFCIPLQFHERWLLCTFLAQRIYTLLKSN